MSNGDGGGPIWGPSGTKIFYRSQDNTRFFVASLEFEPLRVVDREVMFNNERFWAGGVTTQYDIDPSGERFLLLDTYTEDSARTTIHVVLNWFEELKRLVPTD